MMTMTMLEVVVAPPCMIKPPMMSASPSYDECKPFLPMMPMTAASRIHAADAASTLLAPSAAAAAAAAAVAAAL